MAKGHIVSKQHLPGAICCFCSVRKMATCTWSSCHSPYQLATAVGLVLSRIYQLPTEHTERQAGPGQKEKRPVYFCRRGVSQSVVKREQHFPYPGQRTLPKPAQNVRQPFGNLQDIQNLSRIALVPKVGLPALGLPALLHARLACCVASYVSSTWSWHVDR